MTRSIRRPLVTLLLVSLNVHLLGCYNRGMVPRREVVDPANLRITGVTTVRGDTVRFDPPTPARSPRGAPRVAAPTIRADTLTGTVAGELYRLPVAEVRSYEVEEFSTGGSIGLAVGIVAGLLVGLVVLIGRTLES